jgi:hypothetical protein
VLHAVLPILMALAWAILLTVLTVRRRGGPFLATTRAMLIRPRVLFGAAGLAIMGALARVLTVHAAGAALHRADWILLAVLAALAVGFAAVGIVVRTAKSRHP